MKIFKWIFALIAGVGGILTMMLVPAGNKRKKIIVLNKKIKDVEKENASIDLGPSTTTTIKPAEVTAVPSTMPSAPVPKASEGATKEEKLKTLDAGIDMVKMAVKKEERKDAE